MLISKITKIVSHGVRTGNLNICNFHNIGPNSITENGIVSWRFLLLWWWYHHQQPKNSFKKYDINVTTTTTYTKKHILSGFFFTTTDLKKSLNQNPKLTKIVGAFGYWCYYPHLLRDSVSPIY